MTSSQHGLYALGYTHATMQGTRKRSREVEQSPKALLSSDRTLQFACVKSESLVTVDQQSRGEYVLGLAHTARQPPESGSPEGR